MSGALKEHSIEPTPFELSHLQDIEHGTSPDGGSVPALPKKSEKALLARIWGNFDKK